MTDYRWSPIEELSDIERGIDLASIQPLYETWRQSRARLQESSGASLQRFTERLVRRLSVETGILERLYDLDLGTTEALVAKGFAEELVSHSSTDIEPSRLIDILRDQEAAIQYVMDVVARNRDLTRDLIHNLHAILTRHQDTTVAVDPLGNRHEIPLLKGRFKEQPNNPRRSDGELHEYCPPIHVESEMDNLIGWLLQSSDADPIILALVSSQIHANTSVSTATAELPGHLRRSFCCVPVSSRLLLTGTYGLTTSTPLRRQTWVTWGF